MILTVDIGNSHIKFTIFENDIAIKKMRIQTQKSLDNYFEILESAFSENNIDIKKIDGAILSSVVPKITNVIEKSLNSMLNKKIFVLRQNSFIHNIDISIEGKREIGFDIICDLVAGKKKYGKNFIIIDIGTATTMEIVNDNAVFLGGIIMPGLMTMSKFLSLCSQLPDFEVKPQDKIIGNNTIEAMNGGIYWGYIGMLEKNIELMKKEANLKNTKVCFTGSSAKLIIDKMDPSYEFDENLTSNGLYEIWKINNK